jgi:sugar-specific transcriptional regulator TrmB
MTATPSSHNKTLKDYFERLGLEPDAADIYLTLRTYGPQNILRLSRNSGMERTRLYRLLDILTANQLVELRTEYKKTIVSAAPLNNLHILLAKREQDLTALQEELRILENALQPTYIASPATRVQMYRGVDGLKQMFWNQTNATTDTLSILYENMQSRTNLKFFERWVRKANERRLSSRSIIGDHFITTQAEWYKKHTNERLAAWEARYAPPTLFKITHSTIIYNDVVCYYNWQDGEVFGIEMYNQEIADSQRSFFTALWQAALPVDDMKGVAITE